MLRERLGSFLILFPWIFLVLSLNGDVTKGENIDCSGEEYFKCKNSICISVSFICDGEDDCGDLSDETACHLLTTKAPTCEAKEFQCHDRMCIPLGWACDQKLDCLDGSDETLGCMNQSCEDGFQCANQHCIVREWRCDGHRDCIDGSDELNCGFVKVSVEDCDINSRHFLCKDNSVCVPKADVCNRHADCNDGSDEGGLCTDIDICAKTECTFDCFVTPEKAYCICPVGYRLNSQQGCEDINECANEKICDHICNNTEGSFICSCYDGYALQNDRRSCTAQGGEGMMIFATSKEIRGFFLTSQVYYPIAKNQNNLRGVAYDGHYFYWTSLTHGSVAIIRSEIGSLPESIVTSGLGYPEDLAVDWIRHNLYFTDNLYKRIGVCSSDGKVCAVLHSKNVDKPRALVLHTTEGMMYWTDWGERPLIGRSGMDGSYYKDFVTEDIQWPNGLTLDHSNRRLYWVDAKLHKIESIHLDGSDRKVVLSQFVKHPYAIAVFENQIYWSDWDDSEVKTCNKHTGKDLNVLIKETKSKIYDIHIFHSSMEKGNGKDPCEGNKCKGICLAGPKWVSTEAGFKCACPDGSRLAEDGMDCISEERPFLVLATGTSLYRLDYNKMGIKNLVPIPLKGVLSVGAIAYDSVARRVLISDTKAKRIVGVQLESGQVSVIEEREIEEVVSMEHDPMGNNLYWLDKVKRSVEVVSLSTGARATLLSDLGDEIPTGLALAPKHGYVFLALHDGSTAHIDTLSVDGSRRHFVEIGIKGPSIRLVYDSPLERLFWADPGTGHIYSVDFEGQQTHLFEEQVNPVDIAILDSDLLWTEHSSHALHWINKYTYEDKKKLSIDEVGGADDIKIIAVVPKNVKPIHVCQEHNGGCSHICLATDKTKVCKCPEGMELREGREECIKPKDCQWEEFRCSDGECMSRKKLCDGTQDCKEGEDERDCAVKCPTHTFACLDGSKCLQPQLVCDYSPDCPDLSDELHCPDRCSSANNSFSCKSGECLPKKLVCDSREDCKDGSDEEACSRNTCLPEQFRCTYGACIPKEWECDSEMDCLDATDEHSKCEQECGAGTFKCDNHNCIAKQFVCNGLDDCKDNSDEKGCGMSEKTPVKGKEETLCKEEEFSCLSEPGRCFPISTKCNGVRDCRGEEDELGCEECNEGEFKCKSGQCIPASWSCDKVQDCEDNSDEEPSTCPPNQQPHRSTSCSGIECKTPGGLEKECVSFDKLCDSNKDCEDGSDETGLCGKNECSNARCSYSCKETPSGPQCYCKDGFTLLPDLRTCADIDECEFLSSCSHYCNNTLGSFKCSCDPAFQLRTDRRRCKATGPEMEFLFFTKGEFRLKSKSLARTELIYYSPLDFEMSGMDVDMERREVYWTAEIYGTLTRMPLEKPGTSQKISNLLRPSKTAFDWISRNVYLVEKGNTLRTCNFEQKKCVSIASSPRDLIIEALATDPLAGWVFWSETSYFMLKHSKSIIKRSDMSGGYKTPLIEFDLYRVTDMTTDSIKKHLYWTDQTARKIERANYDGSNRQMIFASENYLKDVGFFEDFVYWVNGKSSLDGPYKYKGEGLIGKCGLYGNSLKECDFIRLLPHGSNNSIKRLRLIQPTLQRKGGNICTNVNCSGLCIRSSNGPTCMCEDGSKMLPGQKCPISFNVPTFETVTAEEYNGDSFWVWWLIVGLVLITTFGGIAYFKPTYFPFINIDKTGWPSIYFQNPIYNTSHQVSPFHHTRLSPGEHEYTNPSSLKVPEINGDAKINSDISISLEELMRTRAFSEVEEDSPYNGTKTPLIQ